MVSRVSLEYGYVSKADLETLFGPLVLNHHTEYTVIVLRSTL